MPRFSAAGHPPHAYLSRLRESYSTVREFITQFGLLIATATAGLGDHGRLHLAW